MRTNIKHLARATLACAFIALAALPARAQVTPLDYTGVFTNNITVTNGATTLAGTTNRVVEIQRGMGLGLSFGAYATNAGQLTHYITLSQDGTNYTDASGSIIWGNTLIASSWIVRATNIPASITDNYRYAKALIVSNSAATVYLTNALYSRRK